MRFYGVRQHYVGPIINIVTFNLLEKKRRRNSRRLLVSGGIIIDIWRIVYYSDEKYEHGVVIIRVFEKKTNLLLFVIFSKDRRMISSQISVSRIAQIPQEAVLIIRWSWLGETVLQYSINCII